jgi:hypothetical protein
MTATEPQTVNTDFQLPGACIGCGGPLAVRITGSGAHGCCLSCHQLAILRLEQEGPELRVMIGGAAKA